MMQSVAILGLGLMGSSLGLALKKRGFAGEVRGYARREETTLRALELGVLDSAFTDPIEAVAGADVVVVCVPIQTIPELVRKCLPGLKSGAVITDVGSTKAELLQLMCPVVEHTDSVFVGSHPIAGSEKNGRGCRLCGFV
jgi:prephenate dehydrogenase